MSADDYTSAEIVRALEAFRKEQAAFRQEAAQNHATILRMIADQEAKAAREYVKRETYDAHRELDAQAGQALTKRVDSLASFKDWGVKLILGAFFLALMGLLFASNGGVPS